MVPGGCLLGGVPGPVGGGSAPGGVPGQILPPPVDRQTDACKLITLPQTSFAGGKNQIGIRIEQRQKIKDNFPFRVRIGSLKIQPNRNLCVDLNIKI